MYQVIDAVEKPLRTLCISSPRKLLFATCLLMFLSSLFMSGFNLWLCYFFYDNTFSYSWVNFLGLAILGALLGMICLLGMRGAHIVTLDYLLLYFWFTVVLVAPLAYGTVVAFDFIVYMKIWFLHSWTLPAFAKLRNLFCADNTAKTLCVSPVQGGKFYNATIYWCLDTYHATNCEKVRNDAIKSALKWGTLSMLAEGIVCLSNIGLILISLYYCVKILTPAVITQSMNDIMNFLLIIPIVACALVARNLW